MEKISNITTISTRSSVGSYKVSDVIIANNVVEKEKVVDFGNVMFQNKTEKLSRILPALKKPKTTTVIKNNISQERNITL
ncbi:MAG: hypothetical protein PHX09_02725 [Clostridia bacterium]|nr:hypothetical protein [Clostridia bacterium]MDD4686300.1 hypothetical protein [Clostridia bacterium]